MHVVSLVPWFEPMFWEYVYQDIPHHYFFILDMTHDRASTSVLLALSGRTHIAGMMLIFQERVVQLRGDTEAAKALLAQLHIEEVEIQGLEEHKALILEKYTKIHKSLELVLMTLKRGEERLHAVHHVEQLTRSDAQDMAALMRQGDPDWWRTASAERIADKIDERLWMGVRVNGKLVSIGGASVDQWGSNIGAVVTHEDHRNRGYATSVVQALVEQIFKKTSLALIHVESTNTPAVRAYTKVGFSPYRRYFLARTAV